MNFSRWRQKIFYRPLKSEEVVMPDGSIGHVQNEDTKLIVRVDTSSNSAIYYNFDKRTGRKRVTHISTTST